MNDNFKHSDITNIIIKAYYNVYNKLDFYKKFMKIKLVNYLMAIDVEVGLPLNFGKETEFKEKF